MFSISQTLSRLEANPSPKLVRTHLSLFEVLEGYDPETEELGPYVYRSSLTRQVTEVISLIF